MLPEDFDLFRGDPAVDGMIGKKLIVARGVSGQLPDIGGDDAVARIRAVVNEGGIEGYVALISRDKTVQKLRFDRYGIIPVIDLFFPDINDAGDHFAADGCLRLFLAALDIEFIVARILAGKRESVECDGLVFSGIAVSEGAGRGNIQHIAVDEPVEFHIVIIQGYACVVPSAVDAVIRADSGNGDYAFADCQRAIRQANVVISAPCAGREPEGHGVIDALSGVGLRTADRHRLQPFAIDETVAADCVAAVRQCGSIVFFFSGVCGNCHLAPGDGQGTVLSRNHVIFRDVHIAVHDSDVGEGVDALSGVESAARRRCNDPVAAGQGFRPGVAAVRQQCSVIHLLGGIRGYGNRDAGFRDRQSA